MRLGIMQPYFFPYLGYFGVIAATDRWVSFDTAQYIRHGWVNRNRVLHPDEGWMYIIVPLRKHHRDTAIKDILISEETDWRGRIMGQLQHYARRAPHYAETIDLVERCLVEETERLAELNLSILDRVCRHIGIPFEHDVFSSMGLELGPVEGPGDWALRISEAIGATRYVNPPGADFFEEERFSAAGIELTLLEPPEMHYDCSGYEYQPQLSIIDVLMWNPVERVRAHLIEPVGGSGDA